MPNGNSRELASAAAVVNGLPVDGQHYSKVVQSRLENERQAQGGELSEGESLRIRRETLQAMIEEELALANAQSLGQKSSLDEFRQAVLNDPVSATKRPASTIPASTSAFWKCRPSNRAWIGNKPRPTSSAKCCCKRCTASSATRPLLTPAEQAEAEAKLNRQVRAQAGRLGRGQAGRPARS